MRGILDEDRERYAGVEPASGGYLEMKKLLELDERPTAVFAVSDRLAAGAMRAIAEAGLAIPHDIALVGFDDVRYAQDLDLTTVAQPALETGKTAAEILIQRIETPNCGGNSKAPAEVLDQRIEGLNRNGNTKTFRQVVLPTRLVVRGSCGGRHA